MELGLALRSLRSVSLDTLLARGPEVVKKSQLARYERGDVLPPLKHARDLDRLYRADGWVEMAVHSIWRPNWDPWRRAESIPRRIHAVSWPAKHAGLVWLKMIPSVHHVGAEHAVRLQWGPWSYESVLVPGDGGLLLVTGKSEDTTGAPTTLNMECDREVFLLHGAGDDIDGELVTDIRNDWTFRPSAASRPPSELR
jgi:hypothetical protein